MYNTSVDHEGVSKQDDQEKMEDLKLMTKRMHVKMKDIEQAKINKTNIEKLQKEVEALLRKARNFET